LNQCRQWRATLIDITGKARHCSVTEAVVVQIVTWLFRSIASVGAFQESFLSLSSVPHK
jgi:hypothetical protein